MTIKVGDKKIFKGYETEMENPALFAGESVTVTEETENEGVQCWSVRADKDHSRVETLYAGEFEGEPVILPFEPETPLAASPKEKKHPVTVEIISEVKAVQPKEVHPKENRDKEGKLLRRKEELGGVDPYAPNETGYSPMVLEQSLAINRNPNQFIKDLVGSMKKNQWLLGGGLSYIKNHELYKQIQSGEDVGGNPVFPYNHDKGFAQFLQENSDIQERMATNYIGVYEFISAIGVDEEIEKRILNIGITSMIELVKVAKPDGSDLDHWLAVGEQHNCDTVKAMVRAAQGESNESETGSSETDKAKSKKKDEWKAPKFGKLPPDEFEELDEHLEAAIEHLQEGSDKEITREAALMAVAREGITSLTNAPVSFEYAKEAFERANGVKFKAGKDEHGHSILFLVDAEGEFIL